MVDLSPVLSRAKEVDTVQVGDVDTPTKGNIRRMGKIETKSAT